MADYWGYNMVVNKWAEYTGITAKAYDDEVVYEGETHSFEPPLQAVASGGNAYVVDETVSAKMSGDSVMRVAPRPTSITRSVVVLTGAGGVEYRLYRDQLMNGDVQNVDPEA